MFDTSTSNAPRLRSWLLAAALLWMAVTNGVMLWNTRVEIRQGYIDFANFYTAGTLVRRGQSAELYGLAAQWKVQQEFASEVKIRQGPLPYLRPPFEALFFSIFARWRYVTALLIWTILKLALLATIPFIVVRGRFWKESFPLWMTGILVLGTFPAFMDMLMGQDAVLVAFLFTVCFRQLETGRDTGAGVTLGLALIKFQLAIPFLLVLWISGRKRVLPGFMTSAFVVVAISAALVGWRGLLKYPVYLLALNRSVGVGIAPETQINLRGLLSLFVGRLPYPGPIHWALAPVAVVAIVYTGLIWRKAGRCFLAEGFGLAAIVTIMTSYYACDYDLLLLIVPLLAMLTRPDNAPQADKVSHYLEVTGLLLLLLTPVYWFTRQLHAECLMTLPLLALGVALARRLSYAEMHFVRFSVEDRIQDLQR
ncbi:MAG: glycosyltransferase family 87 protein [Terriglobales bacterium]